MSGFVVSYGKLDQSGFISGEISRPLREVNRMTFVVRVDGDEASTVHTLQLAEELKCGYFLGGGGLRGVRSRARELHIRHSIWRGFEVVRQAAEPRCTSGYHCEYHCEYTRNTEVIFLSTGPRTRSIESNSSAYSALVKMGLVPRDDSPLSLAK